MLVESPEEIIDLPYSAQNEEALLACCLIDGECVDEAATTLDVDDFYEYKHRNLFQVMLTLREKRIPISILTSRDEA